jgi:hypothetical protein
MDLVRLYQDMNAHTVPFRTCLSLDSGLIRLLSPVLFVYTARDPSWLPQYVVQQR